MDRLFSAGMNIAAHQPYLLTQLVVEDGQFVKKGRRSPEIVLTQALRFATLAPRGGGGKGLRSGDGGGMGRRRCKR